MEISHVYYNHNKNPAPLDSGLSLWLAGAERDSALKLLIKILHVCIGIGSSVVFGVPETLA